MTAFIDLAMWADDSFYVRSCRYWAGVFVYLYFKGVFLVACLFILCIEEIIFGTLVGKFGPIL